MKILVLCHRFPYPPQQGGKIRPFHIIRHLSQQHEVTVCSLVRSRAEADAAVGLAAFCHAHRAIRVHNGIQALRMVARLPSTDPSSMGFFYATGMERAVRGLLARETFDLIVVHCSSVAQYVAHVTDVPKLLDFGDMDSQKWREYVRFKPWPVSLGYRFEWYKLERAERRLSRVFDICTTTTRGELSTLRNYATARATDWFPNGVDAGFFAPREGAGDDKRLCFVGRMDYYPNEEAMLRFCSSVWPRLKSRHPDLVLEIVGADPAPAVRRLASVPGVSVTGSVPDVRPYVSRAAAMIAPLSIARGTQNKILESMALGVPVVTSALAAQGVDAVPGEHLVVANSDDEYLAAVERLLTNPSERRRLGQAARQRVLDHHSWATSMQRFDEIIGNLVGGVGRQRAAT